MAAMPVEIANRFDTLGSEEEKEEGRATDEEEDEDDMEESGDSEDELGMRHNTKMGEDYWVKSKFGLRRIRVVPAKGMFDPREAEEEWVKEILDKLYDVRHSEMVYEDYDNPLTADEEVVKYTDRWRNEDPAVELRMNVWIQNRAKRREWTGETRFRYRKTGDEEWSRPNRGKLTAKLFTYNMGIEENDEQSELKKKGLLREWCGECYRCAKGKCVDCMSRLDTETIKREMEVPNNEGMEQMMKDIESNKVKFPRKRSTSKGGSSSVDKRVKSGGDHARYKGFGEEPDRWVIDGQLAEIYRERRTARRTLFYPTEAPEGAIRKLLPFLASDRETKAKFMSRPEEVYHDSWRNPRRRLEIAERGEKRWKGRTDFWLKPGHGLTREYILRCLGEGSSSSGPKDRDEEEETSSEEEDGIPMDELGVVHNIPNGADYWVKRNNNLDRIHVRRRKGLFGPGQADEPWLAEIRDKLQSLRRSHFVYNNGNHELRTDDWDKRMNETPREFLQRLNEEAREAPREHYNRFEWTGWTRFWMRPQYDKEWETPAILGLNVDVALDTVREDEEADREILETGESLRPWCVKCYQSKSGKCKGCRKSVNPEILREEMHKPKGEERENMMRIIREGRVRIRKQKESLEGYVKIRGEQLRNLGPYDEPDEWKMRKLGPEGTLIMIQRNHHTMRRMLFYPTEAFDGDIRKLMPFMSSTRETRANFIETSGMDRYVDKWRRPRRNVEVTETNGEAWRGTTMFWLVPNHGLTEEYIKSCLGCGVDTESESSGKEWDKEGTEEEEYEEDNDYWVKERGIIKRIHVNRRIGMFEPNEANERWFIRAITKLLPDRTTHAKYTDGSVLGDIFSDTWNFWGEEGNYGSAEQRQAREARDFHIVEWMGHTQLKFNDEMERSFQLPRMAFLPVEDGLEKLRMIDIREQRDLVLKGEVRDWCLECYKSASGKCRRCRLEVGRNKIKLPMRRPDSIERQDLLKAIQDGAMRFPKCRNINDKVRIKGEKSRWRDDHEKPDIWNIREYQGRGPDRRSQGSEGQCWVLERLHTTERHKLFHPDEARDGASHKILPFISGLRETNAHFGLHRVRETYIDEWRQPRENLEIVEREGDTWNGSTEFWIRGDQGITLEYIKSCLNIFKDDNHPEDNEPDDDEPQSKHEQASGSSDQRQERPQNPINEAGIRRRWGRQRDQGNQVERQKKKRTIKRRVETRCSSNDDIPARRGVPQNIGANNDGSIKYDSYGQSPLRGQDKGDSDPHTINRPEEKMNSKRWKNVFEDISKQRVDKWKSEIEEEWAKLEARGTFWIAKNEEGKMIDRNGNVGEKDNSRWVTVRNTNRRGDTLGAKKKITIRGRGWYAG